MSGSISMGACFLLAAGVAGCRGMTGGEPAARPVSLAEFARPRAASEAAITRTRPVDAEPAGDSAQTLGTDNSGEFQPLPDQAARPALSLAQPGDRIIVDSLVGEVNGRPIFADEFLQEIEDRLLRAAEKLSGSERESAFRVIVNALLRDTVLNALILSEAEASLSPEQQMGRFAFIQSLQEEQIRQHKRSRVETERALASEGGLDEYLKHRKEVGMVEELRRRKIDPRVIVSWRDIEREYLRRYDEFNPPAAVMLALIRLRTVDQAELIEQVQDRLSGGESFAAIAEELGFSGGGVWATFRMGPGGITDIDVSDPIKGVLAGLEEGQTSEPFTQGPSTLWVHVVSLQRPPARSLYEDPQIQRILRNEIHRRRGEVQWNRYINSLLERGIHDDLDVMADRLHEIAMERYGRGVGTTERRSDR